MELQKAYKIASKYMKLLSPHCERIAIAGSIRREKPFVKDIEIVCIPKEDIIVIDMFSKGCVRSLNFTNLISRLNIIKGSPEGKMVQIELPEKITLDLFICKKDNWGLIYAIRTGSAEFSHKVLARGWRRAGFKSIDGMLNKNGKSIPVYEEEELFDLIDIEFIEPKKRNIE